MEKKILERIETLEYQMGLVAETVDFEKHPSLSLILTFGWSREKTDQVYDIFDEYRNLVDSGQKINWGGFEEEFKDLGIGYQGLKSIVRAFFEEERWVEVCVAYIKNYPASKSLNDLPLELKSIGKYIEDKGL